MDDVFGAGRSSSLGPGDGRLIRSSLTVDEDLPAHLFARNAVESLPDLVCYVLPDRRYRFVNRGYRQWFDVSAPAMSGRRLPGILGEEGYRLVEPYLDRAFAGEPTTFTGTLPLKLGRPRHVEVRLVPDLGEDGKVQGLFTTVRDISHRERILQEDETEVIPVDLRHSAA